MKPLVMLAHGSPDPHWQLQAEAVRDRARAAAPGRVVEVAFLAPAAPTLGDVAAALREAGHTQAQVVALFLSAGGRHVKKDVPELVAATSSEGLALELLPGALGGEPEVVEALALAALRVAGG